MLFAELFGEGLSSVALEDDDPLHSVLADVDINVELGVALIDSIFHVVELLIHEVLWIVLLLLVVRNLWRARR